jgi:nicotinamidase-related amidase
LIVFVKIWFLEWYLNQPKNSPLFGKANEFWVLELWTRWTEIIDSISIKDEKIVIKHRVSPFFETNLEKILQENHISQVFLTWCATDLVVESTARDAHDRDYEVFVFQDCCIAANIQDHTNSLETMKKIGKIITIENL